MKRSLAAVLLGAAIVAAGCGGAARVVSQPTLVRAQIHGPRLAGAVTVVATSNGDVHICTSSISDLVAHFPPRPPCATGLRAVGVRVGALPPPATGQSARWGALYLVGRLSGGAFYVTAQRHWPPKNWPPKTRSSDPLAKPPCPTPQGGWIYRRSHEQLRAVNHYRRLTGHRDITSLAYFAGQILTLASTNPARTRAIVGRYGPRQLCVVRSRYSAGVIFAVRHRVRRILQRFFRGTDAAKWGWPSLAGGQSVSRTGQPTTPLQVFVVTPKLHAFLNRQPQGVIRVEAMLHPLPRRAGWGSWAPVTAAGKVPSLHTALRLTKNAPCGLDRHQSPAGPAVVRRFHAVTAVECTAGTRIYPGSGQWQVAERRVAVSGVAAEQRYFEQRSRPDLPGTGMCTANLVVMLAPVFVDAGGHWIVPKVPVDGCNHPLGLAKGMKKIWPIRWHVVSVKKIRLMISAPALAAGCDMGMGRPAEHYSSLRYPPFAGLHPWTVRVCIYRTTARHKWVGKFVRGVRLDRPQTKRLLSALRYGAASGPCTMTRDFAEVIARHPSASAGVELGGCYRVNGGPGTANRAVIRSILGSG